MLVLTPSWLRMDSGGSKYKSIPFEVQILNGSVLEWSVIAMAMISTNGYNLVCIYANLVNFAFIYGARNPEWMNEWMNIYFS